MAQNVSNMSNDSYTVSKNIHEESGFPPLVRHIYVGYYVIVFLMATLGNLFALLTCYKNYKVTTTTILLSYIASLALADLLFTLLTPVDLAAFLASSWISGQFVCRFQSFLIETSYTASVLTLAMISRERLVAVTTPLLARSQRIKQRKLIPVVIWVISIASCSPLLYAYIIVKDNDSVLQCVNIGWGDQGRQIYYSIQGLLLFLFPLMYMIYSHYRIFRVLKKSEAMRKRMTIKPGSQSLQQRKITKMLAVVTCIFVTCYFPFMLVRTLKYFYVFNNDMLWRLVQLMIFTQAAVNPVVYCFYSKQFRTVFKDLMWCRWHKINHFREGNHTFRTKSSSLEACEPVRLEALHTGKDLSTLISNPSPRPISKRSSKSSVWL
ncbi:QRFP-like peptide receptor [Actinia tenebrosa]|uniref:QRFP-like peptide receptor n=1 Tax=Actinia tenebrosa TaxID=6105 RepID=A0A6P8H9X9_ACTTE|nr:QRFP-like peptide receptor [Actinia tenebrosa]